jgi:Ca2+-binding EF-hand superfamily protein
MVGLQRVFSIMDDDQSGTLTQREFFKACKDFKVGISEENVPALFRIFDVNGDGTMSYEEFLSQVRGQLSQSRANSVKQAFAFLADKCGGRFTVDYIKKVYDATRHPDVI